MLGSLTSSFFFLRAMLCWWIHQGRCASAFEVPLLSTVVECYERTIGWRFHRVGAPRGVPHKGLVLFGSFVAVSFLMMMYRGRRPTTNEARREVRMCVHVCTLYMLCVVRVYKVSGYGLLILIIVIITYQGGRLVCAVGPFFLPNGILHTPRTALYCELIM